MKPAHIFLVIIAVAIVGIVGWRGHVLLAPKKPVGSVMNQHRSQKGVVMLSQQTVHNRAFIEIEF